MTKPEYLPHPSRRAPVLTLTGTEDTAATRMPGLVPRFLLMEQLALSLAECHRAGTYDAFILLDLDSFEAVWRRHGDTPWQRRICHPAVWSADDNSHLTGVRKYCMLLTRRIELSCKPLPNNC